MPGKHNRKDNIVHMQEEETDALGYVAAMLTLSSADGGHQYYTATVQQFVSLNSSDAL